MYSDRMVPNGCRSRMCNQTFDLNVNIVLSGVATIWCKDCERLQSRSCQCTQRTCFAFPNVVCLRSAKGSDHTGFSSLTLSDPIHLITDLSQIRLCTAWHNCSCLKAKRGFVLCVYPLRARVGATLTHSHCLACLARLQMCRTLYHLAQTIN